MLDAANAPRIPLSVAEGITLRTGDMWHEWLTSQLASTGHPFMSELRLTDFMPEGWGGRADWVIFDPSRRAWVLGDIKTVTGDGMFWVERQGAKENHVWQLSAYWHALVEMGLPMLRGFFVLYWPKGPATNKEVTVEASIQECDPLDESLVRGRMEERWALTKAYLDNREKLVVEAYRRDPGSEPPYVTDLLAAPIEREQKIEWDYTAHNFAVKLVPHWSTRFCPYEDELCDCSTQGKTKIGHYDLTGEYTSRNGYEDEVPSVRPSEYQLNQRRREVAKSASES
jgi:hypothetical protein